MENLYKNIGYIGWTEDAAALAAAVWETHKDKKKQYAWCETGTTLPDYVTAVADLRELAGLCKIMVFTDGSDPAALGQLQAHIAPRTTCLDFSRVLPTEKYQRAKSWDARGGFYVDVAAEKPVAELLKTEKPRVFLSGRCAQMLLTAFLWILHPVYVPGVAGEATLMRLLRTTPTGTLSELLPYIDRFRKTCPAPEVPQLISDQPENEGVANALKRAWQMTDAVWQPVKPFPKVISRRATDDFSPEFPIVGLPYSSARMGETFLGVNVPYEGFFTAAEDETSVLYTRDRRKDGNAAAWYGSVCSVLVGNALNLPARVACLNWPQIPNMHLVEPTAVDSLKLGDTMLNTGHVVIITGIDRTADGKIYQVELSEATHPVCRRKLWRPEELTAYYFEAGEYHIYRYAPIADIPYTPNPFTPLAGEDLTPDKNEDLFMHFGNWVNVNLGEELTFRVKTAGWERLQLSCDGKVVADLPLTGTEEFLTYTPTECGDYTAVCVKGQQVSKAVEFTLVSCTVTTDKTVYAPGEAIAVTATDMGGAAPTAIALMKKATSSTTYMRVLTPAEEITLSYDQPGDYIVRVFFRNRYGLYKTDTKELRIEDLCFRQ